MAAFNRQRLAPLRSPIFIPFQVAALPPLLQCPNLIVCSLSTLFKQCRMFLLPGPAQAAGAVESMPDCGQCDLGVRGRISRFRDNRFP